MTLVDLILARKEEIKTVCSNYGASSVRIFGSCARNDYDDKSDIDVLVCVPAELTGFAYFGVLADLEDELRQLLGVKVDLLDEASLKGSIKEQILKEAVAI